MSLDFDWTRAACILVAQDRGAGRELARTVLQGGWKGTPLRCDVFP
jgi:hypothetical protein